MDKLFKTPIQKMRNELMWDYLKTDRGYMSPMIWLKIYFYLDKNMIYDESNIGSSYVFKKMFHMYQSEIKEHQISLFKETGSNFLLEEKFNGYILSIKGWQENMGTLVDALFEKFT